MTSPTNALPHWDLSAAFPGLESPQFAEGFESAVRAIDELVATFDRHKVARQDPAPLDEVTVSASGIVDWAACTVTGAPTILTRPAPAANAAEAAWSAAPAIPSAPPMITTRPRFPLWKKGLCLLKRGFFLL